jgi:hypothetical protein
LQLDKWAHLFINDPSLKQGLRWEGGGGWDSPNQKKLLKKLNISIKKKGKKTTHGKPFWTFDTFIYLFI